MPHPNCTSFGFAAPCTLIGRHMFSSMCMEDSFAARPVERYGVIDIERTSAWSPQAASRRGHWRRATTANIGGGARALYQCPRAHSDRRTGVHFVLANPNTRGSLVHQRLLCIRPRFAGWFGNACTAIYKEVRPQCISKPLAPRPNQQKCGGR